MKEEYLLAIFISSITLAAFLVLRNNNIFYNLGGDNWYLNALVNKHKYYSNFLIDSTIKGIPSYLSPLYFFVIGKLALFLGINSNQALLVSSFLGLISMPLLYFYILKNHFNNLVVILTVVIGCVFYHYEILLKPYQSISALMALFFYYILLPRLAIRNNIKNILFTVLIGLALFLLYYYHFVYLAIAFFIDFVFMKIVDKKNRNKIIRNQFIVYFTIFILGFLLFILPHIIAIAGSSHKIFYGSTEELKFAFLSFPLILGVIDVIKNIEKEYTYRTLVLIFSLSILFVLNLFVEILLNYNIHIFKIQHIIPIILLPHAINFIYTISMHHINKIYENIIKSFIITVFLFFSVNEWITYCFNYQQNSNQYKFWTDIASGINSNINLKDKVVFFPVYNSDLEYASMVPCYRFLPVNNDYGSPASRIQERIEFMKTLDSCKNNPAKFAYSIMNNKIEHIDYLLWNDGLNKLSWETINEMGQQRQQVITPLDKITLSNKYFEKANPNINYLYRIKYENNFVNKKENKLMFLEKITRGRIKKDFYKEFIYEIKSKKKYEISDLKEILYFLNSVDSLSDAQTDSIYHFIGIDRKAISFEIESMPSNISEVNINFADNNASGGYCRKFIPQYKAIQSNVLFFGPYAAFLKGKYFLKLYLKTSSDSEIDAIGIDIYSGKWNKQFFSRQIKAKEVYSSQQYKTISIPFEIEENVDDLEVRGYCNLSSDATISVDKYDIIPQK